MSKPVLPRILGLLVLYCVVFIVLVMVQFTKKGNFTQRIGGMVVRCQYLLSDESSGGTASGSGSGSAEKSLLLTGGGSVNFGGLEFNLRNRDTNEFVSIGTDRQLNQAQAEYLNISKDAVSFILSDGTELIFHTQSADGIPELWISGVFASGVSGVDIPVTPQRTSLIRETSDGFFNIIYDGFVYQFSRPVQFREKAVLSLYADAASISYRAIPERKVFKPSDYILSNARGSQVFNDAITQWKDQKFLLWKGIISGQADEDTVSAYCSEAVKRGNYRDAVDSVSADFVESTERGYVSSVFIGGMINAQETFVQAERAMMSRISQLVNRKSSDILLESHVCEFLFIRGYLNYFEDVLELMRSINTVSLTYDMCPGIFEGYADIKQLRPHGDNPFERLTEQACNIFSDGVRKDAEKKQVFIFRGSSADIEYNLRLGKALIAWAMAAGRNDWADFGHSLILSVLSLEDNTGAVPAFVNISESGGFSPEAGSKLSAARVYGIISPGDYYPRTVVIGSGVNGLWAWTAASAITATQDNNVLDVAVSFPMGETHYIMIRGIRPFDKIQIYNMDYHSDPQFERYDSSGWVFYPADQILTVKLKHRGPVEHIKIFF